LKFIRVHDDSFPYISFIQEKQKPNTNRVENYAYLMAYHLPKVGQVKINDIWFSYTHCMYALIFSLKVTSDYIPNKNN